MYTRPMQDVNLMQYFYPTFPTHQLAKAYVPMQCLNCIYTPMKGLNQGTIFPELDRPYGVDPEYTIDG